MSEKEQPLKLAEPMVRMPCPLSVEEVSELVLRHKEVEEGFIQHTESLDEIPVRRTGPDAWDKTSRRTVTYRICIWTGKAMGEATSNDLLEAVRLAFKTAKIEPPKPITEHLATRTK